MADQQESSRPWFLAALWGAFLAPLFFGSYLGSLEVVSWYEQVPVIVFDWERHIPFLAWTIIPYWSIDFFYGLSLFLCRDKDELNRHGLRLLTAQAIAIPIFLLWPLKLTSTIPADTGIYAPFFGALEGLITKPFNLAPSLHIALLVILWHRYIRLVPSWLKWPTHIWSALIGLSVLTANQHHFFDVPTGALLGLVCLWLWPEHGPRPWQQLDLARSPRRLALTAGYGLAGLLLMVIGWRLWGVYLWLLWPAVSLLFVALAYAIGPQVFQKDDGGQHSFAIRWILAPYLTIARLNAWLWTRSLPESVELHPQVSLGSLPQSDQPRTEHILDLTAEMSAPRNAENWHALPQLDLITPSPEQLQRAARLIDCVVQKQQSIRVCCALGFSRSAAAAATWLLANGHCQSLSETLEFLRSRRPQVRISEATQVAIEQAATQLQAEARVLEASCA